MTQIPREEPPEWNDAAVTALLVCWVVGIVMLVLA